MNLDTIKNQFLSMSAVSSMQNNGHNKNGSQNNFMSMLYGFLVLSIIDAIFKVIPVIIENLKKYTSEYFENKVKENVNKVISINQNKKITSSIIFEVNSINSASKTVMALFNLLCKQNDTIRLIYSSDFIINNKELFNVSYNTIVKEDFSNKQLYCIVKGYSSKENNDKTITFELFSYELSLEELRHIISKIEEDYDIQSSNKIGNKKFYFNEFGVFDKNIVFTMNNFNTNKNLDNIYGPEIYKIRQKVNLFQNNPKWYSDRGIPHTLGILLHGPPGTGKTSTIKAIAKSTNRHVVNISLKETTTKTQLNNLFYNDALTVLVNNQNKVFNIPVSQRIFVIEDIDCLTDVVLDRKYKENKIDLIEQIFDKNINIQTNVNKPVPQQLDTNGEVVSDKITLSFLLNLLDGILEIPNRLLIITTNYPEKLDKALIRPGRIDLCVHLGNCSIETIRDIYYAFYNDNFKQLGKRKEDISINCLCDNILTPAEVVNILSCNSDNDPELALLEIENRCKEYIEDAKNKQILNTEDNIEELLKNNITETPIENIIEHKTDDIIEHY